VITAYKKSKKSDISTVSICKRGATEQVLKQVIERKEKSV
jgi:hypothetical protein